ncbi:LLM class flavin-dependent oxidoreductase [Amycolatopsis sp. cmx-11-32]|uniref:LLM class flavin-dependent oxidoreductase n=1 Tax=Amycolatopsis sp. cmx-11-32 TaxID=2785796 RepID=UPI0039E3F572
MGRQALRVTGELADGTIPFLAGPAALSNLIVPEIAKAAAGRPAPRIIAMVPVVVTDDPDANRATVDRPYAFFRDIPSCRAVFDAQGVDSAGDEETVAAEIRRYFDAGATEVIATQSGIRSSEERLRTWACAGRPRRGLRRVPKAPFATSRGPVALLTEFVLCILVRIANTAGGLHVPCRGPFVGGTARLDGGTARRIRSGRPWHGAARTAP